MCEHEWLIIPGGDISVKRYNQMFPDRKLPEDPRDLPFAIRVAGYYMCVRCEIKLTYSEYKILTRRNQSDTRSL